ncbi:MAG: 5-formyltetrahydrofolate cyclo-ligase [Acidimicrobiia bacterium]|nr:5-formyltetrahydrofolate cyclo-ligase [Acidimicrobiia bacterium]MYC58514.1 5-formyltetrahydrofolate cyclo-ligase [Acidimicrobiia bacterium]MYI30380.1 5-formyltetrahydrofolate cyclo-ligase [Acidimicrobiia bacterium]
MRAQAREARKSHPDPTSAAEAVAQAIIALEWLDGVGKVAATMVHDGELDPAPLVSACWLRGITVCMPVLCDPAPMQFAYSDNHTPLVPNRYGIDEPNVDSTMYIAAKELDMIFAPVVLFDEAGYRAGRGMGYYDRALSFLLDDPRPTKPLVIGLAYECQLVEKIASHSKDIIMDALVTEVKVRIFNKSLSLKTSLRPNEPSART